MYKILYILYFIFLLPQVAHPDNETEQYEEGMEYRLVTPDQQTNKEETEVIEFFWYKCPYCFYFESYLNPWLARKPSNIKFIRIPAIKREEWRIHAQAYYVAESLGILEKIHTPIFNTIHEERRELNSEEALSGFFAEHGISKEKFKEVFHSSLIQSKLEYSKKLTKHYQISGVPTLLVNRKYLTDGSMAGGTSEIMNVVDYLISSNPSK